MVCVKNPFTKKRLESKLHRKYELNLLNEPQHLAEIKTLKLLKIANKGVTNSHEQKLKNNLLKIHKNKLKVCKKCPLQFSNVKVRVL